MADFTIKQGDTIPVLRATLRGADTNVIDLTGCTVRFHLARGTAQANTPVLDVTATIVTAASGVVEYAWLAGDTDVAGDYVGEFEVTLSTGDTVTCPNDHDLTIKVFAQIA